MFDIVVNNAYVIENFPTRPEYFQILLYMFKNHFSGRYRFNGFEFSEKFKTDIDLRFFYYLEIYEIIQRYWIDIRDILNLFKLSQVVTQPGELFALFLNNQARACLEVDNLKLNNRSYQDLYSAWCEYQRCKNYGDGKKLLALEKKLQKKIPRQNDDNNLILEVIAGVIPVNVSKELENKNRQMLDSTARLMRSNRSRF